MQIKRFLNEALNNFTKKIITEDEENDTNSSKQENSNSVDDKNDKNNMDVNDNKKNTNNDNLKTSDKSEEDNISAEVTESYLDRKEEYKRILKELDGVRITPDNAKVYAKKLGYSVNKLFDMLDCLVDDFYISGNNVTMTYVIPKNSYEEVFIDEDVEYCEQYDYENVTDLFNNDLEECNLTEDADTFEKQFSVNNNSNNKKDYLDESFDSIPNWFKSLCLSAKDKFGKDIYAIREYIDENCDLDRNTIREWYNDVYQGLNLPSLWDYDSWDKMDECKMVESEEDDTHICCLCGQEFTGWGNNPYPLGYDDEVCCDSCNYEKVLPARIYQMRKNKSESLDEDTIKTNKGKWVNRGKEGTHGTFKTKKEADAQRKAMFANGYNESIDKYKFGRRERTKFIRLAVEGLMKLGYSHQESNDIAILWADDIELGGLYEPVESAVKRDLSRTISAEEYKKQIYSEAPLSDQDYPLIGYYDESLNEYEFDDGRLDEDIYETLDNYDKIESTDDELQYFKNRKCPKCGKELNKYGYCYNYKCDKDKYSLEEDTINKPYRKAIDHSWRRYMKDQKAYDEKEKDLDNVLGNLKLDSEMIKNIKDNVLSDKPKYHHPKFQGLEKGKFDYYVTYYSEYPKYEPAEGGYYVSGADAVYSKGFDNKEDAINHLKEIAQEEELVKESDTYYERHSKYIGDSDFALIETNKDYLSHSYEPPMYESLNESIDFDDSIEYKVVGYSNRWGIIDTLTKNGITYALLENNEWGDETCYLVVEYNTDVDHKYKNKSGEYITIPTFENVLGETYDGLEVALTDLGLNESIDKNDINEDVDGDYSWFRGNINGTVEEFNPKDLVNKLLDVKTSVHTNRKGPQNRIFNIGLVVHFDYALDIASGYNPPIYVDIILSDPNGWGGRVFFEKVNTPEEAIKMLQEQKDKIISGGYDKEDIDEDFETQSNYEHKNMWVCDRCLSAIESREGKQAILTHYIDDDEDVPCDWCEESGFDTLYELI